LPGIDDLKAAGLLDPLDESIFQLQLDTESEALETESEGD
jgi:segregation and condensation protein B